MSPELTIDSGKVALIGALNRDTLTQDAWLLLSKAQKSQLKHSGNVSVDLSQVDRLDSAGIAWLLNLKRDAAHHSVDVQYIAVSDNVRQLAALSGVEHLFLTQS